MNKEDHLLIGTEPSTGIQKQISHRIRGAHIFTQSVVNFCYVGSTALIPPSFGTSIQNSFLGSTFIPLREVRRTDIQDALLSQSSNLERYAAMMGREPGGFPWLWSISSCFLGPYICPSFHPSMSLIPHLTATFLMTWYPLSKMTFPFSVAKVHFCCLQPSNPNTHPPLHPFIDCPFSTLLQAWGKGMTRMLSSGSSPSGGDESITHSVPQDLGWNQDKNREILWEYYQANLILLRGVRRLHRGHGIYPNFQRVTIGLPDINEKSA